MKKKGNKHPLDEKFINPVIWALGVIASILFLIMFAHGGFGPVLSIILMPVVAVIAFKFLRKEIGKPRNLTIKEQEKMDAIKKAIALEKARRALRKMAKEELLKEYKEKIERMSEEELVRHMKKDRRFTDEPVEEDRRDHGERRVGKDDRRN